jgi:hypothetical protein
LLIDDLLEPLAKKNREIRDAKDRLSSADNLAEVEKKDSPEGHEAKGGRLLVNLSPINELRFHEAFSGGL